MELQKDEIKLILGGGYGLLLRTEHIRRIEAATRFEQIPEARSGVRFGFVSERGNHHQRGENRKDTRRTRKVKVRSGCAVLSISTSRRL